MAETATVRYTPIEQARGMSGLRVAFTRGVPGPWSVAAKAILDVKGLDYVAVAQEVGQPNDELKAWTGQTSAPAAMLDDERPRTLWSEILVLAEQLKPEPRLIPADEDGRVTMFGLCYELCGDDGLGWNVRLLMLRQSEAAAAGAIAFKYSSPASHDHARARVSAILNALAARLERQAAGGSRYFVGDQVTAADIFWTAFSNLMQPVGPDLCAGADMYRAMEPKVRAALGHGVPRILIDHRDQVLRAYFKTPIAM